MTLDHLHQTSKLATEQFISESNEYSDLLFFALSDQSNTLFCNRFEINEIPYEIYGRSKNLYSITDTSESNILYYDICLFHTVIYIVKKLINNQTIYTTDYILMLDQKYSRCLNDYYMNMDYMNSSIGIRRDLFLSKMQKSEQELNSIQKIIKTIKIGK